MEAPKMKTALTLLFATALLAAPGMAQRQAPAEAGTRAGTAFRRADINHDAKLTGAELKQVGIDRRQLAAFDKNKDGGIDRAEFAVVVRKRVVADEQKAGAAARANAARADAARKAEAAKTAARAQAARTQAARKAHAAKAEQVRRVQTERAPTQKRTKRLIRTRG